MVENGHSELKPLFDFRNWLVTFRDQKEFRCTVRRNGQVGLGPITLAGRKKILRKLFQTESKSGLKLIREEEILRIKELWLLDKNNQAYLETER